MSRLQRIGLLYALFSGAALFLMEPGLGLTFVSDDVAYIETNEFVHELSAANLLEILDPAGEPARNTANYAPVHLLAHSLEWRLFEREVLGWHVVNFLMHALVAVLFVELLVARGLEPVAAALCGLLFALHPAHVEATVWISQLKTLLGASLALGALLAHARRPWLGALLFGLALLSKIPALFALPVLVAWTWLGTPGTRERRRWGWVAAWIGIAVLCAVPQFVVFSRTGEVSAPLGVDLLERGRTVVAIGARYIVMASTGLGTVPFHEPDPARSWLDPWWLIGLVLGVLLGGRLAWALAQRREEAAWWVWAGAAWAPIAQFFPFHYPMADRYLYFILPGLLGGVAFATRGIWERERARRVVAVGVVLLALWLGLLTRAQARVWRSHSTLSIATASSYPQGITARRMRAYQAAKRGDPEAAALELQAAVERGFDRFMDYEDAAYAGVRRHPAFDAVVAEMAGAWIDTIAVRSEPTHYELYWVARAHGVRGEWADAEAAYLAAQALGGEFEPRIRSELAAVRRQVELDAEEPAVEDR